MKYYEVKFTISPMNSDASDILASLAGEAGFETFEETETGLTGYIQQALYDQQTLNEALDDFPFEGIAVSYEVSEAEDRDWNEEWEQEGFEPIIISRQGAGGWIQENTPSIVIHDGQIIGDSSAVSILTNREIAEKASLKLTSLYELAIMIGSEDPEAFVDHFITYEREVVRK